jgi:hypothetical protein
MPLSAAQALRAAFEDRETVFFILTSFSPADECPRVYSDRWLSEAPQRALWNVVIAEQPPAVLSIARDLINAVFLEVDPSTGAVLGRRFFKSVFCDELQNAVKRDLDILLGGCRAPRP